MQEEARIDENSQEKAEWDKNNTKDTRRGKKWQERGTHKEEK